MPLRRSGQKVSGVFFSHGFTLIELIISIGIIGMLSTITIVNFKAAQRSREIKNVAETLVSDLRRAQAMTLSGSRLSDGRIARGGYGIFFDPSASSYTLFAEKPFCPDASCALGPYPPSIPAMSTVNGRRDGTSGADYQDLATVTLPATITMTIGADTTLRYVDFAPPRAVLCFATESGLGITTTSVGGNEFFSCLSGGSATITIRLEQAQGERREVLIDRRSGQVSVP